MKCESEVLINAPIQVAWDYMNDPENLPRWIDNLKTYEQLTGDVTQPKPGDTARHVYIENGRDFEMTEEIVAIEAPRHITLKLTSSMFDMNVVNDFKETGDNKTTLTASSEFIRLGFIMRIMMLFTSKAKEQKRHDDQLIKLKELIENTIN